MQLVKTPVGRRKAPVRLDAVEQLRDAGDRLEYVLARYSRLVRELADGSVAVPDFSGRVELINGQLVFVAQRLQELIILEHETSRAEAKASRESAAAQRTAFPRRVVRATA
jgi:hypothetical protein